MAKSVKPTEDAWQPELSRKQSDAWWLLLKDYVKELLYGGAKGGGKSVFGCYWMYAECYEIARKFVPKPRKHPIPVGFMGRQIAKHFKETTLDTWKRFIPPHLYSIKGDPAEIEIANRVSIRTGGLEAKEDLEKFNSAEFARIFIDQAEETTKDDISVLRASQRLVIKGNKIPGKILWTANPAQCWLKTDFVDNPQKSMPFVKALPSDNKWVGKEYIETLESAFSYRPELLEAYRDGNWDAFEGASQIIFMRWIEQAKRNRFYVGISGKMIACDPARYGDDETVIYLLDGTDIVDEFVFAKSKTYDVEECICGLSRQNEYCPAVIDEIGIGGGIIDHLTDKLGVIVIPFNSSVKAVDSDKYHNLRAEAWFMASKLFSEGRIRFSKDYFKLENQLCVPTYKFKNGRLIVEAKEDIKKRIGCSPDRADAYIYGLWAQFQRAKGNSSENELEEIRQIEARMTRPV